MTISDNIGIFGGDGAFLGGVIAQAGVLGGALLLFIAAISLCIMALRAAASARATQREAQAMVASLESHSAELRTMSGDMERLAGEIAERHKTFTAQIDVQMRERASLNASEKPAPIVASEGPVVRRFDHLEEPQAEPVTDEPAQPSALLRGLFRRR